MSERIAETMKIEENKLRRGRILKLLNFFQHEKSRRVNDKTLLLGLTEAGHVVTIPTLRADIHYLAEKGYCEVTEPDEKTLQMTVCWITAKGVDLLEGSLKDIGIDLGED